jgi:quinol monooxygenase YgiN
MDRWVLRAAGGALVHMALAATLLAQAAGEGAVHAVAYFEVAPASRTATIAALRQYRDASRKEDGYVRFDLLEQIGWPGHVVVVETWRDQKSLDSHAAAAPAKQFRSALQPLRTSGYDERLYKDFAVGPAPTAAPSGAVHVVAHVDIGPAGLPTASVLLKQLADSSRKAAGNLRYDILQHAMRANHFTVVETWRDQAALDGHAATDATRKFREEVQPATGSPLDQRLYRSVD